MENEKNPPELLKFEGEFGHFSGKYDKKSSNGIIIFQNVTLSFYLDTGLKKRTNNNCQMKFMKKLLRSQNMLQFVMMIQNTRRRKKQKN